MLLIYPAIWYSLLPRKQTGFYHIAVGANLPIVLGFLDYSKKEGGYLKSYLPTGDLDSDLSIIKAQYQGIEGKYADQSDQVVRRVLGFI